jgi:hypothetical protein
MFEVSTVSFHGGIARDRLLGPHFLPPCLTGAVYDGFLRNVLPELLQDVDLQTGIHIWSMPDGIPPNFLLAVREFLNKVFPGQWGAGLGGWGWGLGGGGGDGPTAWPACSPDLNSLHFYLWRHLKSTVSATKISDVQDLQRRTHNVFEVIRTTPGIFQRVRQLAFRRATSSVEAQGGHFGNFL